MVFSSDDEEFLIFGKKKKIVGNSAVTPMKGGKRRSERKKKHDAVAPIVEAPESGGSEGEEETAAPPEKREKKKEKKEKKKRGEERDAVAPIVEAPESGGSEGEEETAAPPKKREKKKEKKEKKKRGEERDGSEGAESDEEREEVISAEKKKRRIERKNGNEDAPSSGDEGEERVEMSGGRSVRKERQAVPRPSAICQICHDALKLTRHLQPLRRHAQIHAKFQKFACGACLNYTARARFQVRAHLKLRHKTMEDKVLDVTNCLKEAYWEAMGQRCFPQHLKILKDDPNPVGFLAVKCECGEVVKADERAMCAHIVTIHLKDRFNFENPADTMQKYFPALAIKK